MSAKPSPRKGTSIPAGAVGLVFAIIFCIEIAASNQRLKLIGAAIQDFRRPCT